MCGKNQRNEVSHRLWKMVQEKYGHQAPSVSSLRHCRQGFQVRGTVGQRSRSGRTGISDADVARAEKAFQKNLEKSLRSAAAELCILFSTVQKALHEKPGMFRYNISFLLKLLPDDYPRRLIYAQHTHLELESDSGYQDCIVFSDECASHTNGAVNWHDARVWGPENLHTVVELPITTQKILVWCGIPNGKIFSFF